MGLTDAQIEDVTKATIKDAIRELTPRNGRCPHANGYRECLKTNCLGCIHWKDPNKEQKT